MLDSKTHEDVFLSYAREDVQIAIMVVALLREAGISVFYDLDIRNGSDWSDALDQKIKSVGLVLVLWSRHSVGSDWVREEASAGKARQILVAARIDGTAPPLGFKMVQTDDLSSWSGDVPPPAIGSVIARIRELIADASEEHPPENRTARPNNSRGYNSVSDREEDCDAIVGLLPGHPEAQEFVSKGYAQLQSAVHAARNNPDDRVPPRHYALAAQHFAEAIEALGGSKSLPVRHGRPIEYFLLMERANSLARSEPTLTEDPRQEAIAILTRLSKNSRYSKDAPVHFRLGEALSKTAHDIDTVTKAIKSFERARKIVQEDDETVGVKDRLLSEGLWLHAEIARQLGVCNFRLSKIHFFDLKKRRKSLDTAIAETQLAVSLDDRTSPGDSVLGETTMRSSGNLIYMLAERVRDGRGPKGDVGEIKSHIASLKSDKFLDAVYNQVQVLDDIAFAAITIGDWQVAFEEADRIIQMLDLQAVPNGLPCLEQTVEARAREILFYARSMLAERELAHKSPQR